MKLIYVLLFISLLTACRSTRPAQTGTTRRDTAQAAATTSKLPDSVRLLQQVQQGLAANRIQFQTMSAKVKVDYRGDAKNYDVNANVRMVHDSAIWMSVNALLGIEALRALITKDSVKLLDKLNKTYTARPISYLRDLTSLPLNLATLQDLLVGNPVFLDSNVVRIMPAGETTSVLMLGKLFQNLITVTTATNTLQHSKLTDVDTARKRTADLSYSDYDTKGNAPFPRKRGIAVADKKNLTIDLEFKQYDFNQPVSLPFSIPTNFAVR